jgi:hypothetical protein
MDNQESWGCHGCSNGHNVCAVAKPFHHAAVLIVGSIETKVAFAFGHLVHYRRLDTAVGG